MQSEASRASSSKSVRRAHRTRKGEASWPLCWGLQENRPGEGWRELVLEALGAFVREITVDVEAFFVVAQARQSAARLSRPCGSRGLCRSSLPLLRSSLATPSAHCMKTTGACGRAASSAMWSSCWAR